MTRRRSALAKPSAADSSSRIATLLALCFGILLYAALPLGPAGDHARLAWWRWLAAGVAAVAAAAAAGARLVVAPSDRVPWLQSLRSPSPRRRARIAVALAIAAAIYLWITAALQARDFFPKTHDECSYLIQMRMLARGRLWMPRHPLADFFDSFYLLPEPVYASMYFPGASMLYAPALWLHWPTWMLPLIIAGAIVGLVYRVIAELIDGTAGLLAALLVVSLSWFRMHSIMRMSQLPTLLFGLVMLWAWLRWRGVAAERRRTGWLALIGACAGWAAITRPLDAAALALPVAAAVLVDLRAAGWRQRAIGAGIAIAGALPFLAIQLIFNIGVTGHAMRTPFALYADRDLPGTSYGFHGVVPDASPRSDIVQKQLEYARWARPFIQRHQPSRLVQDWWRDRLPLIADVTLPARPLLVLLPLGLLSLRGSRWPLFAWLPLLLAGYAGYTFFLEHYLLVIVPPILMLLLLGIRSASALHPRPACCGLLAATVVFALTGLHELNPSISDEPFHSTLLRKLHDELNETDAIILFTFDIPESDPNLIQQISQEPVYNTDVAWPDDAPVIRAHDLGSRNVELFRYYAARAPTRSVYRFSRRSGRVEFLGKVADLATATPTKDGPAKD